ncbi:unnamed protein product [Rotaria socialis]|uniref:Reverse transcriptase domain-containing protein n=2 Tax=Rotaria socialis TaxID=392032 RepID=A0A820Q389_9BILA|nr:unnamed protein product [Rotaria socialis]
MRHITKEYRIQAMSLYLQSTNREREMLTDEIKHIIEGFPRNTEENDEQVDAESGYIEFKHYNELREKRLNLEAEQSIYFLEKKVSPGRSVEFFIAELNVILQKLHDTSITSTHRQKKQQHKLFLSDKPLTTTQSSQSQNINSSSSFRNEKKKNHGRLVKRLKHKMRSASLVPQKTDKSKKTEAYKCLDVNDPLPNLIERTNEYLLDFRFAHWITQKQYELLSVKPSEAKLAHLYYLPKTHQLRTPLRPIVSGLKHPTIKISTYIDQLLRPLFDKIALKTTTTSGFEVIKQVYEWSTNNPRKQTLLCTTDVVDLYTMIPQTECVLAIKKMLDYLELKQIRGLKIESIIKLSRFVMKNNYFLYAGQYYPQIRGGAMGSPLTLTIANCYMFVFERNIGKQITNAGGLYLRYIDDMFIIINWPKRHLNKQIDQWNTLDSNIQLKAQADEREDLRMALLLNKYPGKFIDNQFNRVLKNRNITQSLTSNNYNMIRKNIIYNIIKEEKIPTDHYRTMFIHFTYCLNIRTLPTKFHTLWNKYFSESPINEIIPVIGTRNVQNSQKQLVKNK